MARRRFQLPRSAPSGLRPDRSRRRRARVARARRCLSLYRTRRLSPRRDRASRSTMLRDRVGAAVTAPLTLVATRPDGVEVARTTIAGASLAAGTATWALPLKQDRAAWPLADRGLYRSERPIRSAACNSTSRISCRRRLKVTLTPQDNGAAPQQRFACPRRKPLPLWRAGVRPVRRRRSAHHDRSAIPSRISRSISSAAWTTRSPT